MRNHFLHFFFFARRSRIFNDSSFQFVRRLLAMHAGTVLQLNVPIPTIQRIQCVYIYIKIMDEVITTREREREKRNSSRSGSSWVRNFGKR